MRHYCTYFDHHYLARGLALFHSLGRYSSDFRLWVLCLSEVCYDALRRMGHSRLELIRLAEFEAAHPDLAQAKTNRSLVEYYFTCTPLLPDFILRMHPEIDHVSYLDSDLYFHQAPELIFEAVGDASIAITPHRFPPELQWKEKFGRFNVGFLSFRRDEQAIQCLKRWGEQCLAWCHDRYEDGRFADQKYLDEWPGRFSRLRILDHPGINAAPWNLPGRTLRWQHTRVLIDGAPLVLFHFHKLKPATHCIYDPHWRDYNVQPSAILRRRVYAPYIRHLEQVRRDTLQPMGLDNPPQEIRRAPRVVSDLRRLWRASLLRPAWYGLLAAVGVVRRKNFLVCRGHVIPW